MNRPFRHSLVFTSLQL